MLAGFDLLAGGQVLNLNSLVFNLGINDNGEVVGVSYAPNFASSRAFVWRSGGRITDLNRLIEKGTTALAYANDINDDGSITGGACVIDSGGCSSSPAYIAIPVR